jgi:hypothetical protein
MRTAGGSAGGGLTVTRTTRAGMCGCPLADSAYKKSGCTAIVEKEFLGFAGLQARVFQAVDV